MSADPNETRRAAMAELARRELERRQGQPEQQQQGIGSRVADVVGRPRDWARAAGITGRGVVGGAVGAMAPITDPLVYGYNQLTGSELPSSYNAYQGLMTDTGVPEPETGPERFNQVASEVITGAVAGRGGERAVMGRMDPVPQTPPQSTPSTDQLRNLSNQAYQRAEEAGVVISPQSFGQAVQRISSDVVERGLDPTLHPRATAALKRLEDASANPLTLKEAETLRKVLRHASASTDSSERMLAQRMIGELDDHIMNLGPGDILAGDSAVGAGALREARNLWSRAGKSSEVENLIERAGTRAGQFSGSGFENAIRTEFRQLVLNPKRMRLFNKDEQDALKRVAQGGPIGNAMRMLGKLAPTGAVSGAIGGGAGYAIGGPAGAVALPLLGSAARRGATHATSRNAALAGELMRRGGPAPPNTMPVGPVGAASGAAGAQVQGGPRRERRDLLADQLMR